MKKRYALSRDFVVVQESFGGSQMWYHKNIQVKTGCGPVALTNVYAWHEGLSLTRAEMTSTMVEVLRFLKGPVIHPSCFIRGARRLFQRQGYQVEAKYLFFFSMTEAKSAEFIRLIKAEITADRPLPLLMGPQKLGGSDYRRDFRSHWVLITALEEGADTVTLEVSSWGRRFQVDLDQLAKSKTFLSLISLNPFRENSVTG